MVLHWVPLKCQKLNAEEAKTITFWTMRVFSTHHHCMTHCLRGLLGAWGVLNPARDSIACHAGNLNECYIISPSLSQECPFPVIIIYDREGFLSPSILPWLCAPNNILESQPSLDSFQWNPISVFARLLTWRWAVVSQLALLCAWDNFRGTEAVPQWLQIKKLSFFYFMMKVSRFSRYRVIPCNQ